MRHEFLNRKVMTADEYHQVVETIAKVLKNEAKNRVSFLLYGSLLDNRLMPGVSDIDCVLFFWDKFVLDRQLVRCLSDSFREAFSLIRFDLGWFLDLSVIDLGNARDGRFIPQNDNFSKIFEPRDGDSKLIYGRSFVQEMSPVHLVDPVESRIAFNLAGLRAHLLFNRCNNVYIDGINPSRGLKIFQQVRSLGRKTMQLIEPNNMAMVVDKKLALRGLKTSFPRIDFGVLDTIETLFDNRDVLIDTVVQMESFDILLRALTCYEEVTREIVHALPPRSTKEKGVGK